MGEESFKSNDSLDVAAKAIESADKPSLAENKDAVKKIEVPAKKIPDIYSPIQGMPSGEVNIAPQIQNSVTRINKAEWDLNQGSLANKKVLAANLQGKLGDKYDFSSKIK